MGGDSAQTKGSCQPWLFFLIADVKTQLKYILEQDGLLEKVFDSKKKAKFTESSHSSSLTDITDGSF